MCMCMSLCACACAQALCVCKCVWNSALVRMHVCTIRKHQELGQFEAKVLVDKYSRPQHMCVCPDIISWPLKNFLDRISLASFFGFFLHFFSSHTRRYLTYYTLSVIHWSWPLGTTPEIDPSILARWLHTDCASFDKIGGLVWPTCHCGFWIVWRFGAECFRAPSPALLVPGICPETAPFQ